MTEKTLLPDMRRDLCRSQSLWAALAPDGRWFGFDPKTPPERLKKRFRQPKARMASTKAQVFAIEDLSFSISSRIDFSSRINSSRSSWAAASAISS